jgi:putative oxidoreductase
MDDYGFRASLPAYGPLVLRLALAAVFIGHGAQKLFGIWGGAGLAGTAAQFAAAGVEPSYPLAVTWGVIQFVGGLLLVIGALTLPAAIALSVLMIGGIWKAYAHGFFLNWNLVPGMGHGSEYYLVLLAALISLMLTGPGAFSIDGRRAESARAERAGRARLRAGKV